uniref:3CxxC-type domain-containing protein n=1 Tax=Bionectria ochroleuca TaxID=29856 RepID=A0A8H7N8A1_BIOOC
MPPKQKRTYPSWSMFPEHHVSVSEELAKSGLHYQFNEDDDEDSCSQDYDTNIMGRFRCRRGNCKTQGWSSKRIAITIRRYQSTSYNVRVYHQRCKSCNGLSRPELDVQSYVDRITYRLKNGTEFRSRRQFTLDNPKPRTKRICVRAARMDVVPSRAVRLPISPITGS